MATCISVLVVAAVAGCGTAVVSPWDRRQWTASEMSTVKVNWTQEQIFAALGKPHRVLGPIRLTEIDRLETWTYFLPVKGTPRYEFTSRIKRDSSCGVHLFVLNGRVLRIMPFGDWGSASEEAVVALRPRLRERGLEELQSEWLADVRQDQALEHKLHFVKEKLLQADQEEVPGVVAGDQLASSRGHAARYVSVGK